MELQAVMQPQDLAETKELIHTLSKAKLLAGGTDLIIDLNKGIENSDYLIDLAKVKELKKIKDFNHHIIIGSMTTFTDILENPIFNNRFTSIRECSEMMGSPQIRNKATIGGNIMNAAAAADIVPCLLSFDAVLIIESINCRRLVRCDDYLNKPEKYKLNEDEILVGVIINDKNSLSGFFKLGKRNSLSIARLSAAVSFNLIDNKLANFRLSLGAVSKHPIRVYEIEYLANGKDVSYLLKERVLSILEDKVRFMIKNRPTMPFKKEAVKGAYMEAVRRALVKGGIKYE